MAKRHMLVDAETPIPKQISITSKINWDLRILCQENALDYSVHMQLKITRHLLAVGIKL